MRIRRELSTTIALQLSRPKIKIESKSIKNGESIRSMQEMFTNLSTKLFEFFEKIEFGIEKRIGNLRQNCLNSELHFL